MTFWSQKRVLVTGGGGFLGSFVVEKLRNKNCKEIFIPRSRDYDLTDMETVKRLYKDAQPDIVIHLAASVGGIGANQTNPGAFFYKNLMMGLLVIEYGRIYCIEKCVTLGTVCAYPKYTPVPFREEDLWNGYPEETNAPYGLAKKMLLVQAQTYRSQYGLNTIYLIPANLYGPRDNFNPATSHVIPALIKKCVDAITQGISHIEVWGTGNATREFLYVEDAAEGILLAAEYYNGPEPINLGAGYEISIKELAHMIAHLTGFNGKILWDQTKPDGQPRRMLNITKAEEYFGFKAKTSLEEGLKKTIGWYYQQGKTID